MVTAKILIVEDEILVGRDMAERLANMGYNTLGPMNSYATAKASLEQTDIDLALIDIKLQGAKDGIELAQFIRTALDLPIIFLTSMENPEVVERAKAVHPSAFLLKPFNARSVGIAIEMALINHALYKNTRTAIPDAPAEDVFPIRKYLFLRKDHFFQRVAFDDIHWIKADGNYTEFHASGERFVQTIQLSKVEDRLPKDRFRRVHRSYIVNIESVVGFMGNTLYIKKQEIPVGEAYRQGVFSLFNSI